LCVGLFATGMNFLKSGLQTVLGSQQPNQAPSGAETVELLVERVTSSTLLEDRRDACRALKALSKKYRIEVGIGMNAMLQVLENDRTDCEIIGYCLDTLCHVTSPEQFEEEEDNPNVTANIGEQFTEIFIKNSDNVCLVLACLEEYDFRVRWAAIKLLTNLLANRPKEIQEIVLVSPMGVSKMMDLLIDSREVIRNDALLLMIQLTKGNGNIQKIVAFENAFDRLLDVIKEEGCSDGGIVVEDCLILMLNLLKNNPSNQQFFKEGSYIQRLAPMLELSTDQDQAGMSPQKVSNLHCMLQVVRALVCPSNPQQALQQQLAHQEAKVRELSGALEQSQSSNAQLQDQNILLKAQLQAAADLRQQTLSSSASSPLHLLPAQGDHQQEVLEKRLSMLSLEQQTDRAKLAYYESENSRLLGELDQLRTRVSVAEGKANESGTELDKLRKDQEDLLELLTDQESKMQRYRMELKRVTGQSFDEDDDVDDELQAIEANDGEGKDAPSMANSSNHPGGFVC
uniref:Uso1/p115-like vesicle tethering protein C-terminal domain-containing protein n=1 Tax=Anopheles coluzzii TaxID=1518534 RepID=A0A8W7P7B5_ANOCL